MHGIIEYVGKIRPWNSQRLLSNWKNVMGDKPTLMPHPVDSVVFWWRWKTNLQNNVTYNTHACWNQSPPSAVKLHAHANEPVNNYSVRQMMFFGFDVVADRAVKDGDWRGRCKRSDGLTVGERLSNDWIKLRSSRRAKPRYINVSACDSGGGTLCPRLSDAASALHVWGFAQFRTLLRCGESVKLHLNGQNADKWTCLFVRLSVCSLRSFVGAHRFSTCFFI